MTTTQKYRSSRQQCEDCAYIDNPVVIVGSRHFYINVLTSYINDHTPAKWTVVDHFDDIPKPSQVKNNMWRLIFVDCMTQDNATILNRLETEADPFLQFDTIALFNLQRKKNDLPQLLSLGVKGFFFETDNADFILKGICALKRGELWVARDTLMTYVSQFSQKKTSGEQVTESLTRREKEVLMLLATGATNEEIADQLFISIHTVKTHIYHILKKLKVQNRLQAALWAARHLN